jgi:hypothetical protein
MKVKVKKASGVVLDWMVAKCEGNLPLSYDDWVQVWPHYSTDWAQGGPIKERNNIRTQRTYNDGVPNTGFDAFKADVDFIDGVMTLGEFTKYGETELIATMRCYVASKFGNEVEVPEDLIV